MISFAYGNKKIITNLQKRGKLLTKGKIGGISSVENRINKQVADDRYYLEFIKPVTAFITFKYQNGMERCLNSFETEKSFFGDPIFQTETDEQGREQDSCLKMLDEKLECREAPEPSNIIWENL